MNIPQAIKSILKYYMMHLYQRHISKMCTFIFSVALFIEAKIQNQSEHPSTDKRIRKINTITHAIATREIMTFVGKWMNLEIIT